MLIEAGKYYITRHGKKVGPLSRRDDITYPFGYCDDTWAGHGRYYNYNPPYDHPLDLIAEWRDAPTPPADTAPQDYSSLRAVLDDALRQAAEGKGATRHANGRPFPEQPIVTITHQVGTGFPLGQALKKIQEASGLLRRDEHDAAQSELLGAIVYVAAAVLAIRNSK